MSFVICIFSLWWHVTNITPNVNGTVCFCCFNVKLVIFWRLDDRYLKDLLVIVLSYMSISFTVIHVTLSMCTMSTVMFLDVSDLLNTVRQFLSWNVNMHWQRLISCGYRTYPTELLMAEMIDILSLNNGVVFPMLSSKCNSCNFWNV